MYKTCFWTVTSLFIGVVQAVEGVKAPSLSDLIGLSFFPNSGLELSAHWAAATDERSKGDSIAQAVARWLFKSFQQNTVNYDS